MSGLFESVANVVSRCLLLCEKALVAYPWVLKFALGQYKTHEMCERAVDGYLLALKFVPNHFKTQEMCKTSAETDPCCLLELSPFSIRPKRYVKELIHGHYGLIY